MNGRWQLCTVTKLGSRCCIPLNSENEPFYLNLWGKFFSFVFHVLVLLRLCLSLGSHKNNSFCSLPRERREFISIWSWVSKDKYSWGKENQKRNDSTYTWSARSLNYSEQWRLTVIQETISPLKTVIFSSYLWLLNRMEVWFGLVSFSVHFFSSLLMLNQFPNIKSGTNKLLLPLHNPCKKVIFKIFWRTVVTKYLSFHSVETLQERQTRDELYQWRFTVVNG